MFNYTSGKFTQIYPDTAIDGAADVLAAEIAAYIESSENQNNFYLTEKGLALYVDERPHAAGDYWIFEAKYSDIEPLLTQKLSGALNK